MNNFYILYFITSLIYFGFGIYILRRDLGKVSRLLFALNILMGFWSFSYSMMYASTNIEFARFWAAASSPGWCLSYGIILHLSLLTTRHEKWLEKPFRKYLLYLPGVVFLFIYYFPGLDLQFQIARGTMGWTWINNPAAEFPFVALSYSIYYTSYLLISAVLFALQLKNAEKTREKRLAGIFLSSLIISVFLGFFTGTVFPLLDVTEIPPLSVILSILPIGTFWYIVIYSRLFPLQPEKTVNEILKNIREGLILINDQGEIELVNRGARKILQYSRKEELVGSSLNKIFKQTNDNIWNLLLAGKLESEKKEKMLLTEAGQVIPTLFSISRMEDNWGEVLGYVCTFTDISKLKEVEYKLEKARARLEKKVATRTAELVQSNEKLQDQIEKRQQKEARIRKMAYYDDLTGLPNLPYLKKKLEQEIDSSDTNAGFPAILFLDLDNFKIINETIGHNKGNKLLNKIAKRLKDSLREKDFVARAGGDEFIIMVRELNDKNSLYKIINKILKLFKNPFCLEGKEFFMTTGIGAALYPGDGETVETLIKNADMALYKAKSYGNNQYEFCTESLKSGISEKMRLTNDLYRARQRNELYLHYQPQVNSRTGKIVGMEALLRWQHPQLGLISPSKFIPIAEKTGLITPIGRWVLRQACKTGTEWRKKGLGNYRMAVNLSRYQFRDENLTEQVISILDETGFDPSQLELEITESVALGDIYNVVSFLEFFRGKGIAISIDDFGIEYSSLNYLKRLPVDKIKIAMSFIQGISQNYKDEAIVKAIIVLARNLGLRIIAEGVETEEQDEYLTPMMCDEIQGFYYYKPLPGEEVEELLRRQVEEMEDLSS
ncbi:MAG: EAL domain-containing protein [Halanaerobiaceae bacterium]